MIFKIDVNTIPSKEDKPVIREINLSCREGLNILREGEELWGVMQVCF